jgi:penicillin-binding protein 1A
MLSTFLERALPGRALRVAAGILWGAVIFLVGLHLILNTDGVRASLRERVEARLAARLPEYELGPHVEVSWTGEVRLGPLTLQPKASPPLLRVEEISVRPSLGSLFGGKLRLGHVSLSNVTLHTDSQGHRWSALLERDTPHPRPAAGGTKGESESSLPTLSLDGLWLVVDRTHSEGPERRFGPFDVALAVDRSSGGLEGAATVWLPEGGRINLNGRYAAATGVDATIAARKVHVPAALSRGGIEIREGDVNADISLTAPADLAKGEAQVLVDLERLVIAGERIASVPVGPLKVGYVGNVHFNRAKMTLSVDSSHFLLGKEQLPVLFEGKVEGGAEAKLDLKLELAPVSLQRLIATLPPQFAPGEDAPHFDGPVSAALKVNGPLQAPLQWGMSLSLDTSGLKQRSRDAPFALREPFSYRPDGMTAGRALWIGPGNPGFVPLRELPPIVGQAVTTSEDAAFYVHGGFDLEGIQNGLAAAVDGSRVRGGSTLTQQLVKNLYLSRERTLARKVSEALITLQLEAALPKARILEIYLNAIEWGPGVYGIADAARSYFGVDARALDAKQAVFLASIIPAPTRWGPYFRKEGLSAVWEQRLSDLLDTLHERGYLTDDDYEHALEEHLHFRPIGGAPSTLTRAP